MQRIVVGGAWGGYWSSRIISAILLVGFMLIAAPCATFAVGMPVGSAFSSGVFNYEVTAPSTVTLTNVTDGAVGEITVPTHVVFGGDDYSVTSIGNWAFVVCTNLTAVTIPDSVISIGEGAFLACTNLTTVTIPDSVISMGDSAFAYCSGLTTLTIGSSLTSIEGRAFIGCTGLASVSIPNSVTSIGEFAFDECTGLESVTIPNSVTSIAGWAFAYCSSLDSITIPDSVISIGDDAFACCSSLTSLTIGNSLNSIGNRVFRECSSLASVSIPDPVTSIGDSAFSGCSSLGSLNIADSVTSIGDYAFSGCSSLGSVNIPNSVKSVGTSGFADCSSLSQVTIPNSVKLLGGGVFRECTSLVELIIPDSVTSIGSYAFSGCTRLISITVPRSLTGIGSHTFDECTALTSIAIPNTVTFIGSYAFRGCTSLTSVTIPRSVATIESSAFRDCSRLTAVTVENPFAVIARGAFSSSTVFDLSFADVSNIMSGYDYTGTPITPTPWVTFCGQRLVADGDYSVTYADWDYSVTYTDNIVPGTATIAIKGQGRYSGVATKRFAITCLAPLTTHAVLSAPPSVGYRAPFTLKGTLTAGWGAPLVGARVRIQRSYDGVAWTTIASPTTTHTGFSITTLSSKTARYRLVFDGDTTNARSVSTVSKVGVRAYLTRPSVPFTVLKGRTFTSKGSLKPRHKTGTYPVVIHCYHYEKRANGTYGYVYRKFFYARVYDYSTYSRYRARLTLPSKGKWRLRAYHRPDSKNVATYSPFRYVTVK